MHNVNRGDDEIISQVGLMSHFNSNLKLMTLKTELKSFLITFVVSVAMVLVSQIDHISLDTFKDGTVFGILFGALRAGVKAVLELLIVSFSSK